MHSIMSVAVRALFVIMPVPGAWHVDPVVEGAAWVLSQPPMAIRVLSPSEIRDVFDRANGGAPPAGLIAFRIKGDPVIYLNAQSAVYLDAAQRPSAFHRLRLAATLMHEQIHETDGEDAAYRRQADFVKSRLDELPADQRHRAHAYWRVLELRAISFAKALNAAGRGLQRAAAPGAGHGERDPR